MRQSAIGSTNYTIYYYITNLQGDVIRLVDVYGNTAAYYRYDPYGKVIEASGSHANINPLRYRSYYYDTDTGLYYLQSRYYDPQICRFINADGYVSTGQGLLGNNMFAYCGNNPENYRDSTGTYYCPTFEFFHREVTHQYGGTFTFYPRRVEDPFDPMGTLVEDFEELVKTPEAIQEADDIADYVTIGQALWDNEVVEIPVGGIRIFLGGRKVIKGVGKWLLPVPGPVDEIWGTVDIIWGFTTIGKGIEQLIIWPEEELS